MRVIPLLAIATVGLTLAACQKKADAAGAAPGASAAPSAPAAAGPATLPHRKAGLWKLDIAMEGPPPMTQSSQVCLDEATEAKLTVFSGQMGKSNCSNESISRGLDGSWKFSGTCDLGAAGKVESTGVATGDFSSRYTVKLHSTTTGASVARMNGTHDITMTGEWTGPCAPGQKGGDMILPNGMKVNMMGARGG